MERDLTSDIKTFYIRGVGDPLKKFIELWKWDRDYTRRLVEKRRLQRKNRKLDRELRRLLQTHRVIRKLPLYWPAVWIMTLYILYMMGYLTHQLNLFGTRAPLPK